MDFILKHWAIVAWIIGVLATVTVYFIKQWRDIEAIKQENIKTEVERNKTNTKIDDYHIAAVSREEKIKLEVTSQIDKMHLKVMSDMNTLEREMKTELKSISSSIERMTLLLIEIQHHNKTSNENLTLLFATQKEAESRASEFFREYGGLLPKLKNL